MRRSILFLLLKECRKNAGRPCPDAQHSKRVRAGDQGGTVRDLELTQHQADAVLDALATQVQQGRQLDGRGADRDPLQNADVQLGQPSDARIAGTALADGTDVAGTT